MRGIRRVSARICLLCVAVCVVSRVVDAAIPHLIRYQGQAVDSNGVGLEGPYTLTFRLYNAETAGTKLWEETQTNVPITHGQFSVLLGQVTPMTSMDWTTPCWLSLQINTDPELTPRQHLTSVPTAMRAEDTEKLNGQPSVHYLDRSAHTGTQPPTSISPQGSSSGLDADTVDGQHASALLSRSNHTGTQSPTTISPQGAGSGLNADLLDGQDSSAFAAAGHRHSCVRRMSMPGGQTGDSFCGSFGEWCVLNVTGGGQSVDSCATTNPGFGDWGAVCCR